MTLSKLFGSGKPVLSFELFPPKTEKGLVALYRHVEKLMSFDPSFLTCTYGAGGSTCEKTMDIVCNVKRRFDVPVASHLTLVDASQDDLRAYLRTAMKHHIDYIVALRGDPPSGRGHFQAAHDGFHHANQLVELIRKEFPDLGIAVAGYPEKHLEAPDMKTDLQNLRRKVDAGADIVITQLFYDNQAFFRFRDQCREIGITVPIVPGILPVTNLKQVQRIVSLCGARLPKAFANQLGERPEDTQWQYDVGVEYTTAQVRELLENRVDGVHFYVLNKSKATSEILSRLDGLI